MRFLCRRRWRRAGESNALTAGRGVATVFLAETSYEVWRPGWERVFLFRMR